MHFIIFDYNKNKISNSCFQVCPNLTASLEFVFTCPYISYKGDSQFEEETKVRRGRVAAYETISIQECR